MKQRCCPLCRSAESDLIYLTPIGQRILECMDCGMVFASGGAPVNYADDSTYACAETYHAQTAHYDRIVENCLTVNPNKDRAVLDVGCALGGLLAAFSRAGFDDVTGISISAAEVEHCETQGFYAFKVDVHEKLLRKYDLITVSHVLEHVPDPLDFLCALQNNLTKGGMIYIEVPDAMRYRECFHSVCEGFNLEHINHFSLRHLLRTLQRSRLCSSYSGSYEMPSWSEEMYPSIWVAATPVTPLPSILGTAIEDYAADVQRQIDMIRKHLNSMENWQIAMWGMGQTSKMLLGSHIIHPDTVCMVTDSNPVYQSTGFFGIRYYSPEQFRPHPSIPILICSQKSCAAITEKIHSLGLANRLITLEPPHKFEIANCDFPEFCRICGHPKNDASHGVLAK